MERAEEEVMEFLEEKCGLNYKSCPLAGNSITTDKMFLYKDMRKLYEFLHYRIIDVSSIKECAFRWIPAFRSINKKCTHKALDDIRESIQELKFYKEKFFDPVKNKKHW